MSESVRLDVLVAAMAKRGSPVVPESGLFVVLESVEALRGSPRELRAGWISLSPEGVVSVSREAPKCSDSEAVRAVAALLDEVLVSMPASAIELISRLRSEEIRSVAELCCELEAMLVPLNRGAARRMLGRLSREHARGGLSHDLAEPDGGLGALLASAEPSAEIQGAQGASDTLEDPPAGGASDTLVEGRTLESAERTEEDVLSPRRGAQAQGWMMVLLALVAMALGALFLFTRLR